MGTIDVVEGGYMAQDPTLEDDDLDLMAHLVQWARVRAKAIYDNPRNKR